MIYLYITTIILASIFFYIWLSRDRRLGSKIERTPFPGQWRKILDERIAFYSNLEDGEKHLFEKRIQLFLAKKRITGIGTDVDDTDRLMVASSAVIPVFGFPRWDYDNLDEILLYPSSFDENYNSADGGHISGMAGAGGWSNTMILSKSDLNAGFSRPGDGSNVGIHEFIHYIDMADGEVDGIPALLLDRSYTIPWLKLIKNEIEDIKKGKSGLNPYGASSDIEFFAVASEYFFKKPDKLKNDHPELYDMLNRIFRQNRLKQSGNRLFKKKKRKPGRNDPCPCGSGEKYKKCCLR